MKALIAALALIGFVGVSALAQDTTEAASAGASMSKTTGDREPAKAKHKKSSKKKKHHSKKQKGM